MECNITENKDFKFKLPWTQAFLRIGIVTLLVRKVPFCYGYQRFSNIFRRPNHKFLPWARWFQSTFSYPVSCSYESCILHSLILSQLCSVYIILTFSNNNIITSNTTTNHHHHHHHHHGSPTVHCLIKTQHSKDTMPLDKIQLGCETAYIYLSWVALVFIKQFHHPFQLADPPQFCRQLNSHPCQWRFLYVFIHLDCFSA